MTNAQFHNEFLSEFAESLRLQDWITVLKLQLRSLTRIRYTQDILEREMLWSCVDLTRELLRQV